MSRRSRMTPMSHPDAWLALLRIATGLYFVKALWTKLTIGFVGGVLPGLFVQQRWITVMPKIVARQASENPIPWYKAFLEHAVLPNSDLFAILTAYGEAAVGLGLVLGVLNGAASLVGLFLVINYGLATQWMSAGQFGFHYTLFFLMIAFFFARAGRKWGLDAWIADRWPDSVLAGRPWS
ncbi:MAG: TQO small subunit DoxD [Gemmatimonadota bacterium]